MLPCQRLGVQSTVCCFVDMRLVELGVTWVGIGQPPCLGALDQSIPGLG